MKILLICEDEYIGRRVLRCLNWKRDRIFVLSPCLSDPIRYSRFVKKHEAFNFALNLADDGDRLRAFAEYADNNAVDIVIPADVASAKFLSLARIYLKHPRCFPISDSETLEMLSNKWSFSQLLDRLALPAPKTALLTDKSQIDELEISLPLVVKPLNERGGHGISVLDSMECLRKHVESDAPYSRFPLIVQEFVVGDWIGCNILSHKGHIIASNIQKNHSDQEISFFYNQECLKLISVVVERARYSGVANFDVILNSDSGDLKILECNPRFWNSLSASKWWGLDFAQLGIDLTFEKVSLDQPDIIGRQSSKFVSAGFLARRAFRKSTSWQVIRDNLSNIWHTAQDPMPLAVGRLRSLKRSLRIGSRTANIVYGSSTSEKPAHQL